MASAFRARFAPLACAAFALVAGCATTPPVTVGAPRLVVVVMIDGLPQRQLTAYRDQLGPDGFNRFLERGAWFADAHFGHANTLTGPGHATVLTGAYPHATGIIGNEWRDPATGAPVYCAGDPAHGYLGQARTRAEGTSPRNLLVESLGDVLRRTDPRSKVLAVSGKDRGAILPAGRDGTAYMYIAQSGEFASTTYYMPEHPPWVAAFNRAQPADRYFRKEWAPLLPEMAYARSVPDARAWFGRGGRLPMVLGEGLEAPGPMYYGSLYASPFLDALMLDFARAAVAGESLGLDEAPDILALSLSGHDYVNHAWGAESRLSHDHVLQVDQLLAGFFRDLDGKVGRDNYVVVLTADHGFMPVPEYALTQGQDAGRLNPGAALGILEDGLAKSFGAGPWVRGWSANAVLLDRARIARLGVDARTIGREATRILLALPGVAAAYTRDEILGTGLGEGSGEPSPILAAVRKGWHRERSADVQVVMRPGWMLSSYPTGTTHGSPHPYDTHVPIAFYGPRWVKPGRRDGRAEVVDIAPTLARILGIAAPSSSEGRPLPVVP